MHDFGEFLVHPLHQGEDAAAHAVGLRAGQGGAGLGGGGARPTPAPRGEKSPVSGAQSAAPPPPPARPKTAAPAPNPTPAPPCPALPGPAHLLGIGQVLRLLHDVLSDENLRVGEEDVQELLDAPQTLLPHLRLRRTRKKQSPAPPEIAENAPKGVAAPRPAPHLHVGGQVGVVVVERGDDVELDLHLQRHAQPVLVSDAHQQLQQLDLRRPAGRNQSRRSAVPRPAPPLPRPRPRLTDPSLSSPAPAGSR